MHSNHLLLEEPIRMASILEPSKAVSIFILFYFILLDLCICVNDWGVDGLPGVGGCRVSSLQWRRSWARWAHALSRSRLFQLVLKLECLVIESIPYFCCCFGGCFFCIFYDFLLCFSNAGSGKIWFFMGWCQVSSGDSGKFEDLY